MTYDEWVQKKDQEHAEAILQATPDCVRCAWRSPQCDEPVLEGARYCEKHARYRMAVAAIRDDGWPGPVKKKDVRR